MASIVCPCGCAVKLCRFYLENAQCRYKQKCSYGIHPKIIGWNNDESNKDGIGKVVFESYANSPKQHHFLYTPKKWSYINHSEFPDFANALNVLREGKEKSSVKYIKIMYNFAHKSEKAWLEQKHKRQSIQMECERRRKIEEEEKRINDEKIMLQNKIDNNMRENAVTRANTVLMCIALSQRAKMLNSQNVVEHSSLLDKLVYLEFERTLPHDLDTLKTLDRKIKKCKEDIILRVNLDKITKQFNELKANLDGIGNCCICHEDEEQWTFVFSICGHTILCQDCAKKCDLKCAYVHCYNFMEC